MSNGRLPYDFPEGDTAHQSSAITRPFQDVIAKCWERDPTLRPGASEAYWLLPIRAISLQIKTRVLTKRDPTAQASGTMVLEWLAKSPALPVDDSFRDILCRAARDASLAMISLLTDSGVSISAVADEALYCLVAACGTHPERDVDRVAIFHLFTKAGADPRHPQYREQDRSEASIKTIEMHPGASHSQRLSLMDDLFLKQSLLLCLATYRHNTSLLSALLDLCQVVESDYQALVVAAALPQSKAVVEMLLAAGVPVDGGIGDELPSPLTMAAYHGNSDAVDLLLAAGADVHSGKSSEGSSSHWREPIYWAMVRKNTTAMSKLLDYHADPNLVFVDSQYNSTKSLLHIALHNDDSTAVTLLLKYGANPSHLDSRGHNAPFFVKNPANLDLLMQNTPSLDLNQVNHVGETPLSRAISMWNTGTALATRFLAYNANPNLGNTLPLHAALQKKAPDMVALLLKSGADPSRQDNDGRNAAFFVKDPTDLDLVMQHSPSLDLNHIDHAGKTPLSRAMWNTALATQFLVYNADPNLGNPFPLHTALECEASALVKLLLKSGADPSRQDSDGRNAAFFIENPTDLDSLMQHTPSLDLNLRDNSGRTPLHHVAKRRTFSIISLLDYGACATTRDNNGQSVLHHLCEAWHCVPAWVWSIEGYDPPAFTDIIRKLINCGVSVDWVDNKGKRAVNYVEYWDGSPKEVVDLLSGSHASRYAHILAANISLSSFPYRRAERNDRN